MSCDTQSHVQHKARAQQLKIEGNAYVARSKYGAALAKYTDAIALDGSNAILWTNRAACRLQLRKYIDARADARKAIELDSDYSKAWSRYGKASMELGDLYQSAATFERAVFITSGPSATDVDRKMCAEYQASLQDVLGQMKARISRPTLDPNGNALFELLDHNPDDMPWARASAKLDEWGRNQRVNRRNSAWVMGSADELFQKALKSLSQLVPVKAGFRGILSTISALVSAIMYDPRVFRIANPTFLDSCDDQVFFELSMRKGWLSGGPAVVIKEAQGRLRRGSRLAWKDVSVSLGVTVRAWVLQAFKASKAHGNHALAVQKYQNAIEVIERGNEIWHNLDYKTRGTMFKPSFIRGIKCLLMDAYMQVIINSQDPCELEKLTNMAQEILDDLAMNPDPPPDDHPDPGFLSSFYIYPKGQSYATMAACQKSVAIAAENANSPNPAEARKAWREAAKFFDQAAIVYPPDDEYFSINVALLLVCHWKTKAPITPVLQLMANLQYTVPLAKQIREHSPNMKDFEETFQKILKYEEEVLAAIESGNNPDEILPPDIDMNSLNRVSPTLQVDYMSWQMYHDGADLDPITFLHSLGLFVGPNP